MKHNLKITLTLLAMFIVTQFIGIYVINFYTFPEHEVPYGMQPPEIKETKEFNQVFVSVIIAFVIAISLFFFLTKFNIEFILKLWFFIVVVIALGIAINSFVPQFKFSASLVLLVAVFLAFNKIYKRNFLMHNFTELLIYPGIAVIFVPLFNVYTIIILLILISVYDMWAVWHSGIMQKMAKYQINKLKIFSGFFVPYISKKTKLKLKKFKKTELKNKKIRVNVGILGGGDIIFPIITAGIFFRLFGLIPALLIIAGATFGLTYLFFFSEKKKFYPAMPFITAGIFVGMVLSYFLA